MSPGPASGMAFDPSVLQHKFETVTNSQENIQTLSLWLIHHKNHHKKVVETWHKLLIKCEWCFFLFYGG